MSWVRVKSRMFDVELRCLGFTKHNRWHVARYRYYNSRPVIGRLFPKMVTGLIRDFIVGWLAINSFQLACTFEGW